jgi:hypothetical protein
MTEPQIPDSGRLAELLREQGAPDTEIAQWALVARQLADWPERHISGADTQRLLAALIPLASARSPVRQALQPSDQPRSAGLLLDLLAIARAQVRVLRPSFWLASAAVTLLGMYIEIVDQAGVSVFTLQALGPLLAFLAILSAFRGTGLRTIEYELACAPGALQLLVARMVVTLGYDVGLGLCLSALLWLHGGASFFAVTAHWLMPLLLVAGLALALSLRLPSATAAGLAYAGWLSALIITNLAMRTDFQGGAAISYAAELALGATGVALLALAAARFPAAVARLLPTIH